MISKIEFTVYDVVVYAFKEFRSKEKELVLTAYGVNANHVDKILDTYKGCQYIIDINMRIILKGEN